MSIDWITVSAQIINFLVLVWLLKRFLYQPVIRAMDRREQRITERLTEAQAREQEAGEAQQDYLAKQNEIEQRQNAILATAKDDAEQQKKQWLDAAREEIDEQRRNWQRQAQQEKAEFLGNLRQQAAASISAIARKALRDLAGSELEERILHVFIARLKSLDTPARKALRDADEPARLASTFALDSALRSRLTRAIHDNIAEGIEVDYREAPELLCGIELTRGGQRLSWNLADYLDILDAEFETAFAATAQNVKEE